MYPSITDLTTYMQQDVLLSKINDEGQTELDLTSGTPMYDRVMQALKGASDLADSYLAVRYTVPVAIIPDVLLEKVLDIVVYKIWSRRGLAPDSADQTVRENYKDALAWLKEVRDGLLALPIPTPSSDAPATGYTAVVTRPRRGF